MTEDESLAKYGLVPVASDLPAIREWLRLQIAAARREEDDCGLMKLCCLQLFAAGDVSDALLIWSAKRSSFDNGFSIDVQLLCGAGIARTKEHLASMTSDEAREALKYIADCEQCGDFERFAVEQVLNDYRCYYGLSDRDPEEIDG